MNGMFTLILLFAGGTHVTPGITSVVIPMDSLRVCEREAARAAQQKYLLLAYCIDRREYP